MSCTSCKQELADFRRLFCGHELCATCLTNGVDGNGRVFCSQCKSYQLVQKVDSSHSGFPGDVKFVTENFSDDDVNKGVIYGTHDKSYKLANCDACKKKSDKLLVLRCCDKYVCSSCWKNCLHEDGHQICPLCQTVAFASDGMNRLSSCYAYNNDYSNTLSLKYDAAHNFGEGNGVSCDACKKLLEDVRCLRCNHKFCLNCLSKCLGSDGRLPCPVCQYVTAVPGDVSSLPPPRPFQSNYNPPHNTTNIQQAKLQTTEAVPDLSSYNTVNAASAKKIEHFDHVALLNECHTDNTRFYYNSSSNYRSLNADNKLFPNNNNFSVPSFGHQPPQLVNQVYSRYPAGIPINHYAGNVISRPYSAASNCMPYFQNQYAHPYNSQQNFIHSVTSPHITHPHFQMQSHPYPTPFYPASQNQLEMNYASGFVMPKAVPPHSELPITESFYSYTPMLKNQFANSTFSSYPQDNSVPHCIESQATNSNAAFNHVFISEGPSENSNSALDEEPIDANRKSRELRRHALESAVNSKSFSDDSNKPVANEDEENKVQSTSMNRRNDVQSTGNNKKKKDRIPLNKDTCPILNDIQRVLNDNRPYISKALQGPVKSNAKTENGNQLPDGVKEPKPKARKRITDVDEKMRSRTTASDTENIVARTSSMSLKDRNVESNSVSNDVKVNETEDEVNNAIVAVYERENYDKDTFNLSFQYDEGGANKICNLYNYKSVIYFDECIVDQNHIASIDNKFAGPAFLHSFDDDMLLISDFNNDRVLLTDRCMRLRSFYPNFKTPKGLWCLHNSQMIVADSKRLSLVDLKTGKVIFAQEKLKFNPWGLSFIDNKVAVCAPADQKVFLYSPDLKNQIGEWDFSKQYTDYRLLPYTIAQNKVATAGTNNAGALLYLNNDGMVDHIVQDTDEPFGNTLLDIEVDSKDTVIFSDSANFRIVSRDINGNMCQSSDGGLISPSGLTLLRDNTLVVSDSYTNSIAFFIC